MTKTELRNLLADGKTNRVLTELRNLSADDIDLHNEVLQISAQFAENDRQRRLNIADPKDIGIEQNRINSVIIIIIDRLPDDSFRKKGGSNWEKIALWFGIFAAVAGFTGYTLKGFFEKKEKNQVVQEKANSEKQTNQSQSGNLIKTIPEPSINRPKKNNKISEESLKQEVGQAQTDEVGLKINIGKQDVPKAESLPKPQQYNSEVKDDKGNGMAGVEVYCPNCLTKKVKTDNEGNFTLEGYFEDGAVFWQSTITFSKDKKIKTETINWREKSPQPIKF